MMTTPFELGLESELDIEYQRFVNKWLFPWHNINIDNRVVEVEDFRGGRFHVGGIVFQGQIQQMYWQAIDRYLDQKIHKAFQDWEDASKQYTAQAKRSSLDGVERSLRQFVARIVKHANETDRALRGQGFPNQVEPYNSSGIHSSGNAKILRLKDAHLNVIAEPFQQPSAKQEAMKQSVWDRVETFLSKYRGTLALIGILIALAFGLLRACGLA